MRAASSVQLKYIACWVVLGGRIASAKLKQENGKQELYPFGGSKESNKEGKVKSLKLRKPPAIIRIKKEKDIYNILVGSKRQKRSKKWWLASFCLAILMAFF